MPRKPENEVRSNKEGIGEYYYDSDGRDVIDTIADYCGKQSALDFCYGNILKYVTRFGKKDDKKKEMLKILRYAERWVELYDKG